MKTIYKGSTDTLTIGETKRLIIGAMPLELAAPVFATFNEQWEIEDGSLTVGELHETCIYAEFIDGDFLAICQQQGITPRHKYRPRFTDYSGAAEQDGNYTITHDEFVKLASLYGATVEIGAAPAKDTEAPAPKETVEQRRARYLAMFTEEERINKRGALQRVTEREKKQNPNADRSNIGKDIEKARGTAKAQKQANGWTSQLVHDGKKRQH